MDTEYIPAKDIAKIIRKLLKKQHPSVKFYVRTSTYAGGASIDIDWMDGPTQKEVDSLVYHLAGSRFDGMIDMQYPVYHVRLPDGSIALSKDPGTIVDYGVNGKRVLLGVDYIHTHRVYSPERLQAALDRYAADWPGMQLPTIETSTWWIGGLVTNHARICLVILPFIIIITRSMIWSDGPLQPTSHLVGCAGAIRRPCYIGGSICTPKKNC